MPDLAAALPMDEEMMGGVLAMPGVEDTDETTPEDNEPPFDSNLAVLIEENDELGEKTLNTLGDDLKSMIEADAESRSGWDRLAVKGLRLMGLTEEKRDKDWMSSAVHSLLAEACVRFQSQAITEIFPPGGPAKPKILAKETEEVRAQGDRVAKYVNYLYTEVMPGAYEQEEKALLHIPREGAVFIRPYWDEARRRPARSVIKAADIILPYSAESLAASPRITYAYSLHENEVRRLMRTGFFREVELEELGDKGASDTESEIVAEADRIQGRTQEADVDTVQGDETYDFWECQAEIELPGFDFEIPLPYMVVMERQSATIMAIYRNWRAEDDTFTRRNWIVKRGFVPNLDGIYDYGLFHLIGGIAEAATGCLRSLLDAAQLSNLQAKLVSNMVNLDTLDRSPLEPGEIRPIPISVDDLRKAIIDIGFGEPSQTMFNLLGSLVEEGRRFASTADLMVGDASNQAPVGTTVALIEQGSKVYSAIHARLHRSFGEELRIISEIVHEYTPDDALYPYAAEDEPWTIRQDFDDRIDVVPVSDPKVFSQSQRIAKMQAALQLSKEAPGLYDQYALHRRMLEALHFDDVDDLMIDPNAGPGHMDGVSENMAMLHMKPVRAYPDQVHDAHIAIHQTWFAALPPEGQKVLQPAFMAHMGEHLAWQYRLRIQQFMPGPLPPPPDFHATRPDRMVTQEIPPQIEAQIDMAAAQAAQQVIKAFPPPPSPEQQKQQAEQQKAQADIQAKAADAQIKAKTAEAAIQTKIKAAAVDEELARKQDQRDAQAWAAEQQRLQVEWEDEQSRKEAEAIQEMILARDEAAVKNEIAEEKADTEEDLARERAKTDAELAKKRAAKAKPQQTEGDK